MIFKSIEEKYVQKLPDWSERAEIAMCTLLIQDHISVLPEIQPLIQLQTCTRTNKVTSTCTYSHVTTRDNINTRNVLNLNLNSGSAFTTLLEKYPTLCSSRKPGGFQLSALAWGELEPSYAFVNFSRLPIASVDRKQHLSEVVFSALVFSLYTSTHHRVKLSPRVL